MSRAISYKKFFSTISQKIQTWNLRKLAQLLTVFAIIIGMVGSYLGYAKLYMTNERRFWLAIENSMSTSSVTRTLSTGGTGNKVVQDQQFFFSPQMVSKSRVSFSQKTATVETSVETEGVSFPDEQYSRYTAFSTTQKKQDGSSASLDNILGKWAGAQIPEDSREEAKFNYIGEMVTLAIFGNFEANYRHQMLHNLQANGAYRLNEDGVVEDVVDGRKVIVIPVTVSLKAYTTEIYDAFKKAGYGEFSALNPDNYRDASDIKAQFMIDPKINTIIGISYGSRQENYKAYGITTTVTKPETEFTSEELEAIVQQQIGTAF